MPNYVVARSQAVVHHLHHLLSADKMSRVTQTSRPSFASKAAWDALGIQSGDETDEEQIDESVEVVERSVYFL